MKRKFYTTPNIIAAALFSAIFILPGRAGAQQYPYYNIQQPAGEYQDDYSDDDDTYGEGQPEVDFSTFYDELSPYGYWEDDPTYGQVWVCNEPGFVPYYSGGNWAYTDAGWAWASTYSWGWAPFHYGRWAYSDHWFWVPGYEWAPAWVNWRSGGGYYGWAPLGPGIQVSVGFGYGNYLPAERWNFCRAEYITSPGFSNYCAGRAENVNIIRNTTVINTINVYHNTRFTAGPDRREAERFAGRSINTFTISNTARPGAAMINRNELQIYRPLPRRQNGDINRAQNNGGYHPVQTEPRRNNNISWQNNSRYGIAPQQNNSYRPVQQVRQQQYALQQPGQRYAYDGRYPNEKQVPFYQPAERFQARQQPGYQPQRKTPGYQPAERLVQPQPQAQRFQAPQRPQYQPQQRVYAPEIPRYQPVEKPLYMPQQANRQPAYNNARLSQPGQRAGNGGPAWRR